MEKEKAVVKQEKNIADSVLARVNQFEELGELRLPKDYNAGNALKSAWLILQETVDRDNKPVLQSCSKESIANALFNMVVQGLSPMKRQCSFVAFGGKLTLMREYNGTIALAKRFGGVVDVTANVIYKDDKFEYEINPETGRKRVVNHIQAFANIDDNKIVGAYATLTMQDGSTQTEVMTIQQIRQSWGQGAAKGNSPAHKNFPGEMAKKTVIVRACKMLINSSNDAVLGYGEDREETDTVVERSRQEIADNANKEEISFDEHEEVMEEPQAGMEAKKPEPESVEETKEPVQNGQQKIGPDF